MDDDTLDVTALRTFRLDLYASFKKAADALMNTNDALLTETCAQSLPELSLSPFFARRWSSLYEAFQDGEIDRTKLRKLFASHLPPPPLGQRLRLGIDASPIVRPHSQTAKDRTLVHVPNLPKSCKAPVLPGFSFSTLVGLPDTPSSWTYVLDNLRIESDQTPAQVATLQLKAIIPLLPGRPLVEGDRYYGSATFIEQTKDIPCDFLVRVPGNRTLYGPAPPRTHQAGAPKKDGRPVKCDAPSSQDSPDQVWSGTDISGKPLQVACWYELHFKDCRKVTLHLIRVTRPSASGKKRDPRISWFVWRGDPPDLSLVRPTYGLRYSMEHGYRFDKQDLLWTKPRFRTSPQFQVWTDLVAAVHNQLVLARPVVQAEPQPWESRRRASTPQQVRRGLARILGELGTPASMPQPRGYSPGRPPGFSPKPAERYEVVVKSTSKRAQAAAPL